MRILGARPDIGNAASAPPLGDRLRVDPVPFGQRPQALLTILYCSTDCRCRAGAPVKNLAHSASFHSRMDNAPSNPETKQLGRPGEPAVLPAVEQHRIAADRVHGNDPAKHEPVVAGIDHAVQTALDPGDAALDQRQAVF